MAEADGDPEGAAVLYLRVMAASHPASSLAVGSRLRLEAIACRLRRGRVAGRDDLRWLDPDALDEIPVSGATRKLLRIGAQ